MVVTEEVSVALGLSWGERAAWPDDLTPTRRRGTRCPTVPASAYQQILSVFHTATILMRAKDICQAVGTGNTLDGSKTQTLHRPSDPHRTRGRTARPRPIDNIRVTH